MINYAPLTKAQVLAALYNASRPQGMGFLHYDKTPMTVETAQKMLTTGNYFDYVAGRVLKVNLEEDNQFEEWLYDRDNGQGAAERVVTAAIQENSANPVVAQETHKAGLQNAADYTRKMAKQRSSISKDQTGLFPGTTTFTLGVTPDEEELLNKAVDKALEK